ncbi:MULTISPECIES: hypothetical protein [Rhodococcus]|uniref:hypothetical protein n=1 Tax=Rhodococcus TaxID=1827 RepID=UPI001E284297|nr:MULTISPECIES: hypothetical protein [Rhodococcus]
MSDPYEIAPGAFNNKYGIVRETRRSRTRAALPAHPASAHHKNFDFEHLKKIHQFILQDVHDWAGTLRTRDTGVVGMNPPKKLQT